MHSVPGQIQLQVWRRKGREKMGEGERDGADWKMGRKKDTREGEGGDGDREERRRGGQEERGTKGKMGVEREDGG